MSAGSAQLDKPAYEAVFNLHSGKGLCLSVFAV